MIPEGVAVGREDRREIRDSISVRPILTHTAVNHFGQRFLAAGVKKGEQAIEK